MYVTVYLYTHTWFIVSGTKLNMLIRISKIVMFAFAV